MFYTHILFGALLFLVAGNYIHISLFQWAVIPLAAILPDIDTENSFISKRLPLIPLLFSGVKHRTLTHSLVGLAVATWLALGVGYFTQHIEITLPFFIGYASHIFADMLTDAGVALLYPEKKRYRLLRIRTGSVSEMWFFFSVLGGIVTLLLSPYF